MENELKSVKGTNTLNSRLTRRKGMDFFSFAGVIDSLHGGKPPLLATHATACLTAVASPASCMVTGRQGSASSKCRA